MLHPVTHVLHQTYQKCVLKTVPNPSSLSRYAELQKKALLSQTCQPILIFKIQNAYFEPKKAYFQTKKLILTMRFGHVLRKLKGTISKPVNALYIIL